MLGHHFFSACVRLSKFFFISFWLENFFPLEEYKEKVSLKVFRVKPTIKMITLKTLRIYDLKPQFHNTFGDDTFMAFYLESASFCSLNQHLRGRLWIPRSHGDTGLMLIFYIVYWANILFPTQTDLCNGHTFVLPQIRTHTMGAHIPASIRMSIKRWMCVMWQSICQQVFLTRSLARQWDRVNVDENVWVPFWRTYIRCSCDILPFNYIAFSVCIIMNSY